MQYFCFLGGLAASAALADGREVEVLLDNSEKYIIAISYIHTVHYSVMVEPMLNHNSGVSSHTCGYSAKVPQPLISWAGAATLHNQLIPQACSWTMRL